MFCEVTIDHRGQIDPAVLKSPILQSFANSIALALAYQWSAYYAARPPGASICAFESGSDCFVILRKVTDVRTSIYHLEGNRASVTVPTMLGAVEKFAAALVAQLRLKTVDRAYRSSSLAAKLFEDNGKETGLVGSRASLRSVFAERFTLKELLPSLVAFVTAALLFWLGLNDNKLLRAALYGLIVAVFFKLVEMLAAYLSKRGTIEWKLKGN